MGLIKQFDKIKQTDISRLLKDKEVSTQIIRTILHIVVDQIMTKNSICDITITIITETRESKMKI